jgi:hypothetical protein
MRHIKSFPIFEDEIDPMTRDWFGLNHTFTISFKWLGLIIQISGPIENKNQAESMYSEIRKTLEDSYYNMDFDPDRGIKESEVEAILQPYEEELAKIGYRMEYNHNIF